MSAAPASQEEGRSGGARRRALAPHLQRPDHAADGALRHPVVDLERQHLEVRPAEGVAEVGVLGEGAAEQHVDPAGPAGSVRPARHADPADPPAEPGAAPAHPVDQRADHGLDLAGRGAAGSGEPQAPRAPGGRVRERARVREGREGDDRPARPRRAAPHRPRALRERTGSPARARVPVARRHRRAARARRRSRTTCGSRGTRTTSRSTPRAIRPTGSFRAHAPTRCSSSCSPTA